MGTLLPVSSEYCLGRRKEYGCGDGARDQIIGGRETLEKGGSTCIFMTSVRDWWLSGIKGGGFGLCPLASHAQWRELYVRA